MQRMDPEPVRPGGSACASAPDHVVGFYEGEDFLVQSVAEFLAPALEGGGSAIAVATAPHRDAIAARLRADDVDVTSARASGALAGIDAAQALEQVMAGGAPDPARFAEAMGGAIDAAAARGGEVRVHGEMVALLWDRGEITAALALEELWNELLATRPVALFCAYPMRAFEREDRTEAFHTVCRQHAAVVPSESYSNQDADEQRRTVALLQQEAIAGINARVALRRREHELADELARTRALGWLRDELIATLQDDLRAPVGHAAPAPRQRSVDTFRKSATRIVRHTLEAEACEVVVPPSGRRWLAERAATAGCATVTVALPTQDAAAGTLHVELGPRREPTDDDLAFVRTVAELVAAAMDHERARRRLQQQPPHDRLTGLAQRPALTERIEQALERSRRHGGLVAVLFIDLDRFKAVNDALGHRMGDRVLAAVGRRLAASLRLDDTLARLGGDEFAALLAPVDTPAAAVGLARRLVDRLATPLVVDGVEVAVTASVGVALGRDGDTAETVLDGADGAMYQAKAAGGAGVHLPREAAGPVGEPGGAG